MMAGAEVLCLFWWALFLQGKVLLGAGREQGKAGTGKMLPDKLLGGREADFQPKVQRPCKAC